MSAVKRDRGMGVVVVRLRFAWCVALMIVNLREVHGYLWPAARRARPDTCLGGGGTLPRSNNSVQISRGVIATRGLGAIVVLYMQVWGVVLDVTDSHHASALQTNSTVCHSRK